MPKNSEKLPRLVRIKIDVVVEMLKVVELAASEECLVCVVSGVWCVVVWWCGGIRR